MNPPANGFPKQGKPKQDFLAAMDLTRQHDINWRHGRIFSTVYPVDQEINDLLKEAFMMFFTENGLNPTVFPNLRKFETEVVAMTASLLGGGEQVVGNMTFGGTESLLMAVRTARDWARANMPGISTPEMILPSSAHPAFDKAAQYFGVNIVRVPVRADLRADVDACRAAICSHTIMQIGSCPAFSAKSFLSAIQ